MTQEVVPTVSEMSLTCLPSPYDLYREQKLHPKELEEGIQSDMLEERSSRVLKSGAAGSKLTRRKLSSPLGARLDETLWWVTAGMENEEAPDTTCQQKGIK